MNKQRNVVIAVLAVLGVAVVIAAVLTRNSGTKSVDADASGAAVAGAEQRKPSETEPRLHKVESPMLGRPARVKPMPKAVARLRSDREKDAEAREYMPDRDGRVAAELRSIQTELKATTASEKKLELIEEMAEKCHPEAINVVRSLLSDKDPEVRAEALWALEGYTDPAVVPLAMAALDDPDPEVRQAALGAIAGVKDPVVKEPVEKGLQDPEEPVRDMAGEVIEDLGTRVKLELLEDSIKSPYEDVKVNAIEKLEDMANPYAFDVLIEGLRKADPEMKDFVNESIYFLVSESFDSYEAAKTWWDANRNRYDENLFEKE
jgi:hypothetical protein